MYIDTLGPRQTNRLNEHDVEYIDNNHFRNTFDYFTTAVSGLMNMAEQKQVPQSIEISDHEGRHLLKSHHSDLRICIMQQNRKQYCRHYTMC